MAAVLSEGRRRCASVVVVCVWLAALVARVYGDCSAPPRMDYGELLEEFLSLEEYPVGTSITYKCRPGYLPKSRSFKPTIKCLETLQWSRIAEFCKLKDCGNPGEPLNGRVEVPEEDFQMPNTKFGSVVTFYCNTGFILVGRRTRTCTASGWSNAIPICEIVICPPPPEIANGKHTEYGQEEYRYLSGVTYRCNAEYMELIGSRMIYCTETGAWSDPAPICKDRRCPEPVVENGRKIDGFKPLYVLGDEVEFRCKEGFHTKDLLRVKCDEKNKWEPPVPVCKPIICIKPPPIVNGSHSGMDREEFKYHEYVTYKCDSNELSLIGEDTIRCIGEGEWSGQAPRCKHVLCETPVFPNGTQTSIFNYPYRYKATVTLECKKYFGPKGLNPVTCNETSQWTPEPPVCKDLRCPNPVIENGKCVSGLKNTYERLDVVKFQCLEAFKMEGQAEITCGEENKWSPALPVCRPIRCGKPPIIRNGTHTHINQEEFQYGDVVVYECNSDNLSLIGKKRIRCTRKENWDHPAPLCKVVNCKDLHLENGNITSAFQPPYKYGNVIDFKCNKDFLLVGDPHATCREDSKWDAPLPRCQRNSCPNPVIKNGQTRVVQDGRTRRKPSGPAFPVNTEIEVTCNPGYKLVGETKIKCATNFIWYKELPTCSPITCSKPEIEHGTISNENKLNSEIEEYRYADRVKIQCHPNYILKGNISVIQCTNESKWSALPICEPVICREPEIENGRIIPVRSIAEQKSKKEYRVDDKAEIHCNDGYFLHGENEILCRQDSTWSSLPTCDFVCCSVQQAQNGKFGNLVCKNIKVEKPQLTNEILDNATFHCDDGYIVEGTKNFQCRTNSDPSKPAECKPGEPVEVPTRSPPKFVALGKHDLNEKEVLGLNQKTIAISPIQICQFVEESISKKWEKMDLEEKYIILQMWKLCQEIIKKLTK